MPSPIAIAVRTIDADPSDPATLIRDAVLLEPIAHPQLAEALEAAGATRRGTAAWSYQLWDGVGRRARPTDHAPLAAAFAFCRDNIVGRDLAHTDRGAPRRLNNVAQHRQYSSITEALRGAPNLAALDQVLRRRPTFSRHETHASSSGVLAINREHHTVWLRAYTHFLKAAENEPELPVRLDLRPAGRAAKSPRPVLGIEAVRTIAWLNQHRPGLAVVDHDGFARNLTNPRAVRRLLAELAHDPSLVLADIDLLRTAVKVLGDDATVAKALKVAPEQVAAAREPHVDVAKRLTETARRSVAVAPQPGRPARSVAYVGRQAPKQLRQIAADGTTVEDLGMTRQMTIDATAAAELAAVGGDRLHIEDAVLDVAAMAAAAPHDDPRLFDYQNVMVGRFLATSRGMGNFSAPGAGKTPTTLAGFDAAAKTTPSYRALVVCEANARFQWFDHANEWCPDFHVVLVDSRKKLDDLKAVLAGAGDEPVLVITSYALASDVAEVTDARDTLAKARTALVRARGDLAGELAKRRPDGDLVDAFNDAVETAQKAVADAEQAVPHAADHLGAAIFDVAWHDLAVDEAVGLRGSSKTSRALWSLREHATRALVLTGTPINRDVADVAKLLSWAFGDRRAWYGVDPTETYDLTDISQAKELLADLGPTAFRIDKSEIDVALPNLSVEVVPLKLRREELALAEAARTQLKEKFVELLANLDLAAEQAEALAAAGDSAAKEALAEAKAALREAKGAWLGSTTLARQAAADPVALLSSETAGAEVLRINGLVQAATAQMGTKRRWALEYIDAAVDADMQVVLFTEFGTVARAIIGDLRERGLRVGEVLGGGGAARDEYIRAFRNGDVDVLVCTSAGERGLNLQTRNGAGQVLIHFDLPWTASGVVQRTGRVERIGGADHVQVVFPVASGTIEDRVAGLVCARATAALQALDVPRGIEVGDTDFGRALGRLALDVDVTALRGGERALLEMTRALLADDAELDVPLAA